MSYRLISELQTRVDRWRETMLDDAARALPNCRFVAADIRQYQPEQQE